MTRQDRATRLRETYEGQFGSFNEQQLETEIIRQLKLKKDHEETKKANAKAYGEYIREAQDAIDYCVERIDYLQNEEAVAPVLEG